MIINKMVARQLRKNTNLMKLLIRENALFKKLHFDRIIEKKMGPLSEKKTLLPFPGVNLLLAIVLFGTIVGDMLPVTNTTPLIGQPP